MFRNYQNYEICEDGRIWSKVSKKWMKPYTRKDGYQQVGLTDNEGKQHMQLVHRITWIAVKGEIPEGMQLNHKDECKSNNHIDNLELVTPKENINFGTRNSRVAKALKGKIPLANPNPPKRVGAFKNGELVLVFPSTMEAGRARYYQSAVVSCCNGNRKSHKGYEWKYLNDDN